MDNLVIEKSCDSDSDWEDDDDFLSKKINIKIKPIAQLTPGKISASVDELRATVGTWKSMANVNLVKPNSRRSHYQSTIQLNRVESKVPAATVPLLAQQNNNNNINVNNENNSHPFDQMQPAMAELPSTPFLVPRTANDQIFNNADCTSNGDTNKFSLKPVAFAVQECLNVRILMSPNGSSQTNLVGHIKMAVPQTIINSDLSGPEGKLDFKVVSSRPWDTTRLNQQFVHERFSTVELDEFVNDRHNNLESNFCPEPKFVQTTRKKLSIDMKAVQSFALQQNQISNSTSPVKNKSYYLLPELLNYSIESHEQLDNADLNDITMNRLSPIHAVAHWLCDLNITKVRIDFEFLYNMNLQPHEVKNIKICMHINGGVLSSQSKPAANWSHIDSGLTWSFMDLNELLEKSTINGVTSCLARFDLGDGPSTPGNVSLQFSIGGRTLSGTHVVLDDSNRYELTKQKYEVRTGMYRCEPPCL